MTIDKATILKALSTVEDPDLKKDLVSLNMIQDLSFTESSIEFTVMLTTPACPLKELIRKNCEKAIFDAFGESVELNITMSSNVTSTRQEGPMLPNVKNIIAVASGKGGVGKSTVSANLALGLAAQGAKVGLVDADIFGPSIPTMFGCEDQKPGIIEEDGKNKIIPITKHGIKLISIGFLTPSESAVVWRGPMANSALRQFFSDCEWGELDYLIVDLPPGTSDIHLTLVQTLPVTGAVIVTTPQKVAISDAQKAIAMFRQPQINVPILGLIENMAYFTPAELPDNKYFIFGQNGGINLAEKHNIHFLGQIPLVQSVREGGDSGKPAILDEMSALRDTLIEMSSNLARRVAIRNAEMNETKVVEFNS